MIREVLAAGPEFAARPYAQISVDALRSGG
jgi:hypothetical protein